MVEVEIYAGYIVEYNAMKQEFQAWKNNTKIFFAKTQEQIENMIDGKEANINNTIKEVAIGKKYPARTCPKCGHTWNPKVPSPKKCARCGLCMPEWREEQKKRLQQYYKDHKSSLQQGMDDYRRTNRTKIRLNQNEKYMRERALWTNGICVTREIWSKAEVIAQEILIQEGFEEILYLRERSFPFDYLAKKDGMIYAVDVTTAQRKPIRPLPAELCLYLNLNLLLLFIKPDMAAYRLVPIHSHYLEKPIYKSFNIHSLRGFKKLELG